MALPATDSFTNSNGTQLTSHSASWTLNDGDFDIQTNALAPDDSVGGNECGAHWNADSFDNDQYAEATVDALGVTGTFIGLACRAAASGATYYGFYNSDGTDPFLFKQVSGSWTELGNATTSWSATDTIRLEANGTTIRCLVNDVEDESVTDSAISSGSAGVAGYTDNTTPRIDDWEGGNISTALSVNVSDTVTVAESITVTLPDALALSVSDAIAVAESIGRQLVSYISVSDAITVAESVALALVSNVTVSDTVTVAESIGTLLTSFVNVSDAVSVAEDVTISVGAAGAFEINVSDTVTVGESDSADVSDPQVSVSDAVGVAESVGVSVVTGYSISVSDAVAVAEAVTLTISDLALSVSESVSVAETVGRLLTSYIGVSDSVAVTDSPTVSVEVPGADLNVSVNDSVSVSDVAVIAVFLAAAAPGLRVASSGIAAIRAGPQIIGTVRTAGTDGPLIRNTDETG